MPPSRGGSVRGPQALGQYEVALSRTQYTLVWTAIAVLYFLSGLFCSMYAFFYYVGTVFKGGYYVDFLNGMPRSKMPLVIGAYAFAALIYWSRLTNMLTLTVRRRALSLSMVSPSGGSRRSRRRVSAKTLTPIQRVHRNISLAWEYLRRGWSLLWSADGLISVDGPLYELLLMTRELVEVALQTYQVEKASALILQPGINRVFVGCLVLNCWVSPAIHTLTARFSRQPQRRWLYLWADVILDFVAGLVIPLLILLNLLGLLWRPQQVKTFVFDAPFDDVVLMDMILSSKQLFVANGLDFASKMLPIYSMGKYLDTIRRLARCENDPPSRASSNNRPPSNADEQGPRRSQLPILKSASVRPMSGFSVASPQRHAQVRRHLPLVHRVCSAGHWLLLVWGLAIVAFHISAEILSSSADETIHVGCKAAVRPWFERRFACSVMEINCFRRTIQGSAHEIDAALAKLSPSAIVSLIITHCPAFEMPARIQTLTNLVGLELTNVSVVAWDASAALRSPRHDSMAFLSLVRTNLSQIPEGLRSEFFPKNLRSIQISVSKISSLPNDLHLQWRRLLNVYIEHSQLTQVPTTIALMEVDRLSLLGNRIASIPDDLLCENEFGVLSMANNPMLTALPMCVGSLRSLQTLVLDGTNMTSLPPWLPNHGSSHTITLSIGRTPLCQAALNESRGNLSEAEESIANGTGLLKISCRDRPDEEIEAYALTQNKRDRVL